MTNVELKFTAKETFYLFEFRVDETTYWEFFAVPRYDCNFYSANAQILRRLSK
jgi:hypothetical protein